MTSRKVTRPSPVEPGIAWPLLDCGMQKKTIFAGVFNQTHAEAGKAVQVNWFPSLGDLFKQVIDERLTQACTERLHCIASACFLERSIAGPAFFLKLTKDIWVQDNIMEIWDCRIPTGINSEVKLERLEIALSAGEPVCTLQECGPRSCKASERQCCCGVCLTVW